PNRATGRVLRTTGSDVVVPEGQGCCGALNAHGGDHARAVAMARATIDTFEAARADVVVVNTSGCGAHMKAYGHLLIGDRAYAERAGRFAASARDLAASVSRRARPEDQERAPAAPGPDSRAPGRRADRVGLVLWVGGDLQPHAT